jgi:predicted membrane-bound spermidine synthase
MQQLYLKRSAYQQIELEGDGRRYRLWLDGYFQFDSATERSYHEVLANLPLALSGGTGRVLILGGGDGLCAREALKYGPERVVNVELDPAMVELARAWPLRELNLGSFDDPRVEVVVGDALEYVARPPEEPFDVVIADFPADTSEELSRLYTEDFYRRCRALVAPEGVFVTQAAGPGEDVRRVRESLRDAFGHSVSVISQVDRGPDERFVFASPEPLRARRDPVGAPFAAALIGRLVGRSKDCLLVTIGGGKP